MPDVKWYAGSGSGTITIGTTLVAGGTTNRLLRNTGTTVGNSLLSDDATNITLGSGSFIINDAYLTRSAAGRISFGSGAADASGELIANTLYCVDVSNALIKNAGNLRLTSDGLVQLNGTGVETLQALSVGQQSLALASTYLFIQGVSGAGGTPTTPHLTAGSGVCAYTQQAHDAVATKYVIAYNLGGSMRYLSILLDGSTTTWVNNATRP